MSKWLVTIGIEIHLALNTKSKMFSGAANDVSALPNSQLNEIDLGYPGTMPSVNKEAVIKAIKLAKALKMSIAPILLFDRKNYFYPDLPKGYQITQNLHPIGRNGQIYVLDQVVTLERIHLEEDTAKSIHQSSDTLLDYNRAGVPLIEIVTNPVITSTQVAGEYVDMIRQIALALDISDAKMEKGSLRADVNLSLRPVGSEKLGTRVEIKNMNSIRNIKRAIEIEVQLQKETLEAGQKIAQTTKRFDEQSDTTVVMREKTDAVDYKYFPEPNIPPIALAKDFVDRIKINELPWERTRRYQKDEISPEYVELLVQNIKHANYFDSIDYGQKSELAKVFFAHIVPLAKKNKKSVSELMIDPAQISETLSLLKSKKISSRNLGAIFSNLIGAKKTLKEIIVEQNMSVVSDPLLIKRTIEQIIEANKEFVLQNAKRPERLQKFIVGQVMKETRGQAEPQLVSKVVKMSLETHGKK